MQHSQLLTVFHSLTALYFAKAGYPPSAKILASTALFALLPNQLIVYLTQEKSAGGKVIISAEQLYHD